MRPIFVAPLGSQVLLGKPLDKPLRLATPALALGGMAFHLFVLHRLLQPPHCWHFVLTSSHLFWSFPLFLVSPLLFICYFVGVDFHDTLVCSHDYHILLLMWSDHFYFSLKEEDEKVFVCFALNAWVEINMISMMTSRADPDNYSQNQLASGVVTWVTMELSRLMIAMNTL